MKIAFGCDHGGIVNKDAVIYYLSTNGHEVKDFGTFSEDSCDYPEYAKKVTLAVVNGECDYGILICGTGIGIGQVMPLTGASVLNMQIKNILRVK